MSDATQAYQRDVGDTLDAVNCLREELEAAQECIDDGGHLQLAELHLRDIEHDLRLGWATDPTPTEEDTDAGR